jgi:hypothetical protein
MELLAWANRKSASIKADPWLVRSCYLSAVFCPRSIGLYTKVPSDEFGVLTGKRDYIFSLNRARELALDVAIAMMFAIQMGLNFARTFAHDLGLNELAKELDELSIPTTNEGRQEFSDTVQALMIKHRGIGHDWNLTEIQEECLANYLNATHLLEDCLELAFIPPNEKKIILNGLYLPPAQVGEGQSA